MYYVHQVNRKEVSFPFWMVVNAVKSIIIFLQEKRRRSAGRKVGFAQARFFFAEKANF